MLYHHYICLYFTTWTNDEDNIHKYNKGRRKLHATSVHQIYSKKLSVSVSQCCVFLLHGELQISMNCSVTYTNTSEICFTATDLRMRLVLGNRMHTMQNKKHKQIRTYERDEEFLFVFPDLCGCCCSCHGDTKKCYLYSMIAATAIIIIFFARLSVAHFACCSYKINRTLTCDWCVAVCLKGTHFRSSSVHAFYYIILFEFSRFFKRHFGRLHLPQFNVSHAYNTFTSFLYFLFSILTLFATFFSIFVRFGFRFILFMVIRLQLFL